MKKLLAIDGNSILNRAYYGIKPLTTSTGLYTNAIYGMVTILWKNITNIAPDAIVTAFDVKAPTFRHKEYDAYKAGRKPMPEELAMQLPYAKKIAAMLGSRVVELEGWEADDVLGTLAGMADDSDGEWETFILTGDRDSLQLISKNVTILLATNSDTISFDRERFISEYGVTPEQFVDVKALMGDSSDNIPGVPGIGEKTAVKLIAQFGTLESIYSNLDDDSDEIKLVSGGIRKKLAEGRESAFLSQKLARIDKKAPLGFTLDECVRGELERGQLLELFRQLEFGGLIKRLGLENSEEKRIECKSERLSGEEFDGFLAETTGKTCALCLSDGLTLSFDGETIVEIHDVNIPEAIEKLKKAGKRIVVYDSKLAYHQLEEMGTRISSTFDADVMLTAYVLDPDDGNELPERLAYKYLGTASQSPNKFNAVELYRINEVMEKLIAERGQEKLLSDIEMPLAKVLEDMENVGFKIDLKGLEKFSDTLAVQIEEFREQIYCYAGEEFNINSPKQLGDILFDKLGLPSGKKTSRGYSTNADILEKLAPLYPIVSDILEFRKLSKLRSTYGEGLAKAADRNGVIHTSFNQTVTATGRLSSTEPNLQNIPVRTELGREMRRFFIPSEPGRVLIDADYSQIELRILAHISGDETMINAFRNGIDIHAVTASEAFGVPLELVTPEMRKRAKAINFGIVYGISDFSLAQDIGVSRREAADYIAAYMQQYTKVAEYLKSAVARAHDDGYVTTMFGRRRYIPEINSPKKMVAAAAERIAMNSPIQGTAADIIKIAMINVARALRESGCDAKLILQVHDELIVDSSREDSEKVRDLLVREMENCVKLAVPLTVSAAIGESWYDCKD